MEANDMPVRKKTALKRQKTEPLTPLILHYFQYGFTDELHQMEGFSAADFLFDDCKDKLRELWREYGAGIVADWQKVHPGTMPYYMERYGHET
jgi:hypothetical protein